MATLKLILKITSWICFGVGLVWTNKVSLDDTDEPPPRVMVPAICSLSVQDELTVDVENVGEINAVLALGSMSESMLMRADSWLAEFIEDHGTTKTLRFTLTGDSNKVTWEYPVHKFSLIADGSLLKDDNSFLYLAQGPIEFKKTGTYQLRAEFVGEGDPSEEIFDQAEFFLILGDQTEDVQNYERLDPRPGLVLLSGTFGVIIHLFLVLIHFIVPLKDALPEIETEF